MASKLMSTVSQKLKHELVMVAWEAEKGYCQMFKASLNYIGSSRLAWTGSADARTCVERTNVCHVVRSCIHASVGAVQHRMSRVDPAAAFQPITKTAVPEKANLSRSCTFKLHMEVIFITQAVEGDFSRVQDGGVR